MRLNAASTESLKLPYLSAAILLCPSFTMTPMACFSDALRLAADHRDDSQQIFFRWAYASASSGALASSSGLAVEPTIALREVPGFDCIVVCGGLLHGLDDIDPAVFEILREANERSKLIISLCTGSFVLARAGIMKGRSCAILAHVLSDFVEMFPDTTPLTRKNYWIEGNIITCPGGILSLDVAAHVIRTWSNPGRAIKALDYLMFDYENPRTRFAERPYQEQMERASDLTRDAILMMETHMDSPFPVAGLASRLATTRTRLSRLFTRDVGMAPGRFWLEMRLNLASRILLERNISVTEVGYSTGFNDTAHFCRRFKARFALSPKAFRLRYRK